MSRITMNRNMHSTRSWHAEGAARRSGYASGDVRDLGDDTGQKNDKCLQMETHTNTHKQTSTYQTGV